MQSKQDLFTKMNMDINPNKVSQEQGVFIKGVNGSVISDGGSNNFKWTSDTGTEHLFNLPYKTMVSEAQRYATANLYYFDGRSIGFGVESPTSSRSFLFEVYKSNIKKGFVYAENVHNVSFATYTIKIYIELEGLGYNTTEVVTAGTLGSWSIEHYLLNKTVTLFNTIPSGNRGNLSWSLKRHFVQPAFLTDIDKEQPILIAGDGYRVDLFKAGFAGNENQTYMLEVTATGNLNIWTLFRDQNILTFTKQYSLATPYSYAMIGDCQSGI